MPRYGNSSVSSLLSSAQAAQKRQESLEDSIAAYTWDLSAKTTADLQVYLDHLGSRRAKYLQSDPAKALEYEKKMVTSNRDYTSKEIFRAGLDVLEGKASNTDKLNKIVGYYQQAVANGDMNLAQSLYGQADRLTKTIQDEAIAAANARDAASAKAAAAYKKGYDKKVSTIEKELTDYKQAVESGQMTYQGYTALAQQAYKDMLQTVDAAGKDPALDPEQQQNYVDRLNKLDMNDTLKRTLNDANRLATGKDANGNPVQAPLTALRYEPATNSYSLAPLKVQSLNVNGKDSTTGVGVGKDSNLVNRRVPMMDSVVTLPDGSPNPNYGKVMRDAKGMPIVSSNPQQIVETYSDVNGQQVAPVINSATGRPDLKYRGEGIGIKEDNPYFRQDTGFYAYDKNGNFLPGFSKDANGKIVYNAPEVKPADASYGEKFKDFYSPVLQALHLGGGSKTNSRPEQGFLANPIGGFLGAIIGKNKYQQEQDRIKAEAAAAAARAEGERLRQQELSRLQNLQVGAPAGVVRTTTNRRGQTVAKAPFRTPQNTYTNTGGSAAEVIHNVVSYNPFGANNVIGNYKF